MTVLNFYRFSKQKSGPYVSPTNSIFHVYGGALTEVSLLNDSTDPFTFSTVRLVIVLHAKSVSMTQLRISTPCLPVKSVELFSIDGVMLSPLVKIK